MYFYHASEAVTKGGDDAYFVDNAEFGTLH